MDVQWESKPQLLTARYEASNDERKRADYEALTSNRSSVTL